MNKEWDKKLGVKKLPTLERFIIKTDDIELFHLTPNLFLKDGAMWPYTSLLLQGSTLSFAWGPKNPDYATGSNRLI
jgi:hypothetical protein